MEISITPSLIEPLRHTEAGQAGPPYQGDVTFTVSGGLPDITLDITVPFIECNSLDAGLAQAWKYLAAFAEEIAAIAAEKSA